MGGNIYVPKPNDSISFHLIMTKFGLAKKNIEKAPVIEAIGTIQAMRDDICCMHTYVEDQLW